MLKFLEEKKDEAIESSALQKYEYDDLKSLYL